ncbi:MAG: DUF3857 domain-containing protein [Planctomycetota bacterium]
MTHRCVARGTVILWILGAGALAANAAGPPQPATADEIKQMLASAKESKDYDNADLVYVLDEADVYVQDSGLATTESCQVIKVLTDAGVRSQAVLRQEFDPATNRITVKAVRIHRKDGGLEEVAVTAVITQPAPQHAIYWGNRQHVLDIPRLEIGDGLEIRISKIGYNIAYLGDAEASASRAGGETLQPPMPGHWYEVTLFQNNYPILKKRYSVHMPKDKPVQYEVYNGNLKSSLWFAGDRHVYTFSNENIPKLKEEPHGLAPDDCAVKLVMATVPDWEMKSRWFWDANKAQFDADDEVRAKVAELTAGLNDDEARIAALNHWVADNVRYYGTSRGPCEGFTLHKGTETIRDLGGVCKDKAGMLVTLLRAAGFEAYPALTMAGSRVETIPADQFNHTVTVLKEPDGSFRILDPTWIPLSREMWSSREALQHLVYGTPEGQTLTLSPYYPPEYNQLVCRSEGVLGPEGTLSTRITMDLQGYPCTYLRRYADRYPKPEQRAAFEQALNIAPNARLEEFAFTDPRDYSRDGHVDMKVSASGYAAGAQRVRLFRLPLMSHPLANWLIPDFFYPVDTEKREFGMRMRATRLVRYEETLKLPPGWKVKHVPDKKTLDSGSAALTFEATPGEGTLTYRFELALKNHIIPPKDYPDWKKAVEAMKEITEAWIVCTVEED